MQSAQLTFALLVTALVLLLFRNRQLRNRDCPAPAPCPAPPGPCPAPPGPVCFPLFPQLRQIPNFAYTHSTLVTTPAEFSTALADINAQPNGGRIRVAPVYLNFLSQQIVTKPCYIVCEDSYNHAAFHQQGGDRMFLVQTEQFYIENIFVRAASAAANAGPIVIDVGLTQCDVIALNCSFVTRRQAILCNSKTRAQLEGCNFLYFNLNVGSEPLIYLNVLNGYGDWIVDNCLFHSAPIQYGDSSYGIVEAIAAQSGGNFDPDFSINVRESNFVNDTFLGPFNNIVRVECELSSTRGHKVLLYNNFVQGVQKSFLLLDDAVDCDNLETIALLENKVTYRASQTPLQNGPFPLVSFLGQAADPFPANPPTVYLNGNEYNVQNSDIVGYQAAASNAPVAQIGYSTMDAPAPLLTVLSEGGC